MSHLISAVVAWLNNSSDSLDNDGKMHREKGGTGELESDDTLEEKDSIFIVDDLYCFILR